ncbi:hypothetical protein [Geminicoccus flavidas]|uniref:hypothetical protein n=1 Tax=Geminicoccus flavidas TaxID=2506407 RepID=UPI001356A128|nr:hypothetical protein [Geminicoccus flavidas]
MKVFLASAVVAILLAVAASSILGQFHEPAYQRFASNGAYVDHPGHNLVGPDWSGLAPVPAAPES